MSAEMKFFIYLLEHVAEHKKTTADKILAQWDAAGITDKVYGMYGNSFGRMLYFFCQ